MSSYRNRAISSIKRDGICLVFPINNKKAPPSLWFDLFPRSQMRWEWDENGDSRVAELWHLREELSRSGKVVYSKWYQGRATFFSRPVFTALLAVTAPLRAQLTESPEASEMLTLLEESSPLSTKSLKRLANLEGKFHEKTFQAALKKLWLSGAIVGFGEVDDGAFPSLAMGATQIMFEDLWREAANVEPHKARDVLNKIFSKVPEFARFFKRLPIEPFADLLTF